LLAHEYKLLGIWTQLRVLYHPSSSGSLDGRKGWKSTSATPIVSLTLSVIANAISINADKLSVDLDAPSANLRPPSVAFCALSDIPQSLPVDLSSSSDVTPAPPAVPDALSDLANDISFLSRYGLEGALPESQPSHAERIWLLFASKSPKYTSLDGATFTMSYMEEHAYTSPSGFHRSHGSHVQLGQGSDFRNIQAC